MKSLGTDSEHYRQTIYIYSISTVSRSEETEAGGRYAGCPVRHLREGGAQKVSLLPHEEFPQARMCVLLTYCNGGSDADRNPNFSEWIFMIPRIRGFFLQINRIRIILVAVSSCTKVSLQQYENF